MFRLLKHKGDRIARLSSVAFPAANNTMWEA